MKQITFFIFALYIVGIGCAIISNDDNGVEIRVSNQSKYQLNNFYINTSGGESSYRTINAGKSSDYASFDYSYSYFYVSVDIDTSTFVIQPIDYVGESKIKSGKYTYTISVESIGNQPVSFSGQLNKD